MSKKGGIAGLSQGRSDVFKLDPRDLHIKAGWNSRDFNAADNLEHVDELARSIAVHGVMKPVVAYYDEGKAWIADGECRIRATMRAIEIYKADIKAIPVLLEERYANDTDKLLYQYIRNTGKPFSPIELSNHFKRLLGAGYEAKDIAEKTGLSQGRISQILGLQLLPEAVKKEVQAGHVSATLAASTVKELGPTEAEQALKNAWVTAVDEGKAKVTPAHIEGAAPTLKKAVQEFFEYADIDTDAEEGFTIVKVPYDKWAVVRDLLDL